jgi:hypothetical protein
MMRKELDPRRRPLTEQMQAYLAALYWRGSVKGCKFGVAYDSTRKSLVKRGLLMRVVENRGTPSERARHVLTDAGVEVAKTLPDPRENGGTPLHERLAAVRAGRW